MASRMLIAGTGGGGSTTIGLNGVADREVDDCVRRRGVVGVAGTRVVDRV